jgi:hypothetical protein
MRIKSLPAFLPSRLRIRLALSLSLGLGLAGLCLVPPAGAEYGDVVLNRISEANDMRPVIFPHSECATTGRSPGRWMSVTSAIRVNRD